MTSFEVLIVCEDEFMPKQGNSGDAGYDLKSSVALQIKPGERMLVATGIKIAMPKGYVGLVHPRSGLAVKNGITVLNTPGTIDAGYRGEVAVTLINHSDEIFVISKGDRIAQLLFQKFESPVFVGVTELPGSQRGTGGFGSTGVK